MAFASPLDRDEVAACVRLFCFHHVHNLNGRSADFGGSCLKRRGFFRVTLTTNSNKGSTSCKISKIPIDLAKTQNIFGYFSRSINRQTASISQNYAACNREEYHWRKCAKGSKFFIKIPTVTSQPIEPIPSYGKELSHWHLKNSKLCNSAKTTDRKNQIEMPTDKI